MGTSLNLLQLLPLLLLYLSSLSQSQTLNFSYYSFDPSNRGDFFFSNDSLSSQGALQITPDSANSEPTYHVNRSGRVFLNRSFTLWQSSSTAKLLASFSTSFTVNVFRPDNTTPGEGMAFIIAPSIGEPPINSYGQYLGLTNATLDGNPSNSLIAIELDTVKQDFDPDNNHMGLNINSVISNHTASLTPIGIEISPVGKAAKYTVWVDYDGGKKHIWIYIAVQHQPKPTSAIIQAPLDLSQYVQQVSYFGFAGSTGSTYELNCVLEWNLTVQKLPDSKSNGRGMVPWKWALAVGLPLVAVVVMLGVLWRYIKKAKCHDNPNDLELTLHQLPGQPKEFDFKVLKKATNNFAESLKLGQGGFGVVYKGVIPVEDKVDTVVAVKQFSRENIKGQDDFLAELRIINMLRHKHLVRLLGWCHKDGVLLLVYEFMPNGSVDHHLFSGPDSPILTWSHRYTILTGVASALHYLHNEYEQKVIHRDLKASNILLDSNFNARLGDFGLARALDTDKTSYVDVELGVVAGTMGYIAPECFHTGKATCESDVYGFGAVILEIVCGKKPRLDISGFMFLVDWVWKLHREGRILDAVDSRLDGMYDKDDAMRLLLLGLACSHPSPKERPETATIVQIISRSIGPPVVPPFRPPFVWPSGPVEDLEESEECSMTSTVVTSGFYASSMWTPRRDSDLEHAGDDNKMKELTVYVTLLAL